MPSDRPRAALACPTCPGRVAIVTDSTASLPDEVAEARGVVVVPLQVVVGAQAFDEGRQATQQIVADALRAFDPVSTSRPAPEAFAAAYEAAAAGGATAVVSVHLSAEVSGTYDSAVLAAEQVDVPVVVVDSRQVGLATGFAVLSAAEAAERGASADEVAEAAAVPGRGRVVVLLRRHPRAPAPRRPHRSGGRPARHGAGGQAAADRRRRSGGAPREGAYRRPGAGADRGARLPGRGRRAGRRGRAAPGRGGAGRAPWPTGCGRGCRAPPRYGCARSAPSSACTWDRAWSP